MPQKPHFTTDNPVTVEVCEQYGKRTKGTPTKVVQIVMDESDAERFKVFAYSCGQSISSLAYQALTPFFLRQPQLPALPKKQMPRLAA